MIDVKCRICSKDMQDASKFSKKIIEEAGFKKGDELEAEAVKGEVRLRRV